jgi:acyl dehydratase
MQQTFADFKVGDTYPSITSVVPVNVSGNYASWNDDDNPWFHEASPFGGPIAHLTVNNADFDRFLRANGFPMNGLFPVKTNREFYRPILLGSTIVTSCEIVEAYERKGRHYVTFEFVTSDEQGQPFMKKRDTLVQMPPRQEGGQA